MMPRHFKDMRINIGPGQSLEKTKLLNNNQCVQLIALIGKQPIVTMCPVKRCVANEDFE